MIDHNDLALEMQYIDKMAVPERIAMAKKRRKQQLATYAKWAKTESMDKKSKTAKRRGIRFASDIELLDTAARAATDKGAIEEMRTLIKSGINPNRTNYDGLTALHQACIDGTTEMVMLLLKAGANVNMADRDLWTPLHAAATCGHFKIVTTLIKAGANLIAINGDGDTPYDITEDEVTQFYIGNEMTKQGFTPDVVEQTRQAPHTNMMQDIAYILENGGDINQPLDQGGTLLHTAIANNFNDAVAILMKNGAAVTARDEDGWEPIHVAAYWCNEAALNALVSTNNVNLRSRTDNGEMPYELCEDPDLKVQILHMISDQPELYRFDNDITETDDSLDTPADEQTLRQTKNGLNNMVDDTLLETQSLSDNDPTDEEKSNDDQSSVEEKLPTNPLLNLQAIEFTERRNSVKEAKHMAPMKRMSSTESVNNSPNISLTNNTHTGPFSSNNTRTGSFSSNNTLQYPKTTKLKDLEKENLRPISADSYFDLQPLEINHNRNTVKEIGSSDAHFSAQGQNSAYNLPAAKEIGSSDANFSAQGQNSAYNPPAAKEIGSSDANFSTQRQNSAHNPPPLYNNQNGSASAVADAPKKEDSNKENPNTQKMVYLPRKKHPAPLPPEGSLLHLKKQRQEARHITFDVEVLPERRRSRSEPSERRRSKSEPSQPVSVLVEPPPSPTMIRYHFKMVLDDEKEEQFIREKKCAIM